MFTRKAKIALLKGIITKKAPVYVQFSITKNCNLGCAMCSSSQSRREENDLSLGEIKKMAEVLDKIKVGIILLTGGEPFLRDDIVEIIRIFSKKGLTVRLQTNGILATEDKIKSALQAGMKEVTLSLHSLTPEIHDTITGQKGSWNKIIESISRFSTILPCKNTLLGINTVVCPQNINELTEIIAFTTKIGFYSSLIPIHVLTAPANGEFVIRKEAPDFSFSKEKFSDIDRVYNEIIKMKKKNYNIYNSYRFLRNSPEFLKGKRIKWHCDSPNLYFAISPSGNFLPCVDIKTPIPMLTGNFIDLYNSSAWRLQFQKKVKNCAGCFYACWPEITFLCRDPFVLVERLIFGINAALKSRKTVTYNNCLEIISQIKKNKITIK